MPVVFTSCSVNYLARAKTLADSLRAVEPDWHFVVCLVDELPTSDLEIDLIGMEIVPVASAGVPGFAEMAQRYDVVELSTAVKPFFFQYLLSRFPDCERFIYLDPDIMVFGRLSAVDTGLDLHEILLTPHLLEPSNEGGEADEILSLKFGIYNLGFVAIRRGRESDRFLAWWAARLRQGCRRLQHEGLFVDQLVVNLAPIFFSVGICRHRGFNVAYWNLRERIVSERDGQYRVGTDPLVFVHFSSYDPARPDLISASRSCRFTFDKRPDLKPLFAAYQSALMANGETRVSTYPCRYVQRQSEAAPWRAFSKAILRSVRRLVPRHYRAKVLRALVGL